MQSNRNITRLFRTYAELLLLHSVNERLAALLSGAAFRIQRLSDEVGALTKATLSKLFAPEITFILEELKKTGTIEALDELVQLTPQGLFEMMRIRGLGGKKLSVLWKTAEIDSIDSLLEACKKGEISKIKGFGQKTQENIVKAIDAYRSNQDRYHYASVADIAEDLVRTLAQIFPNRPTSLCGEIRRKATTVAGIEILTAIPAKLLKEDRLRRSIIIQGYSKGVTRGHTLDEIPVTVYHTSTERFAYELFLHTGNEQHVDKVVAKLKGKKDFTAEDLIYREAGLPFILPELREDLAEWQIGKKNESLIAVSDIRGVVHNHTDWSDGVDTLTDFVNACYERGYEYTVISDHSKNAHYAGGLKEEAVIKQLEEISRINQRFTAFRIFKSIECDILVSGDLDYNEGLLDLFDLVIVSVHQLLKMDEKKATKRLLRAIENPHTTILGHMTGRQLLIRPGYPVDVKKVIDACASNNVVIEINANPYRLDMDWTHIPYALKKGVMLSVNPDAHSIHEIDNIRWGVEAARKGGLTKEMTWNAMSLEKIEQWLRLKHG